MSDAESANTSFLAFAGVKKIAEGSLPDVAIKVRRHLDRTTDTTPIVFDRKSARQIELDYRGTDPEIRHRASLSEIKLQAEPLAPSTSTRSRGRGRPKLGVVAGEVTLLPRHWAWLKTQRGGASVTLRRLVDDARRNSEPKESRTEAQDSVYRAMVVLAGDLPGYEEALRALYANDADSFTRQTNKWPSGVKSFIRDLSREAFA